MITSRLHSASERYRQRLTDPDSQLGRYRAVAVGEDQGLKDLLVYELINTFILPLPGGLGRVMRNLFFPMVFGKFAQSTRTGVDCTIRNPRKIRIEEYAVIEDGVTLDVKPHAQNLFIGRNVLIGRRTILNCAGGIMTIGNGTQIGPFSRLGSKKGLQIGRNCRIGEQACLSGAAHAYDDRTRPIVLQAVTCKGPTILGDFVTVGDRSTLLDGVIIGNNVQIAPDSLVIRDIPDNSVVAGVPAAPLENRN